MKRRFSWSFFSAIAAALMIALTPAALAASPETGTEPQGKASIAAAKDGVLSEGAGSLQARPAAADAPLANKALGRPRIGLALGGGGTRGVAHLGVINTLVKAGIPIDCISGTSMGAIVGGLYAAGLPCERINTIFHDKSMLHSYETVPITLRVCVIPIFFIPHIFGHHPYDGLYKGNKFCNFINDCVPEDQRNIESLKIPFVAVCSDLLNGKPYTISKGNLGRALQASSAIPGLRRPLYWQQQLLVDGGVVANLPVDECKALGPDIVIAVNVDEQLCILPDKHFRKIGSVGYRCLNMHLSTIDSPQAEKADYVIHPDVAGVEILSSKVCDMEYCFKRGQEAAEAAIPEIRELIKKKSSEHEFVSR